MLETCYPFELKNIESIGEYLFIIKNCFRLIGKYGINRKSEGLIFFIRWEKIRKKWVIDFSNKTTRKSDGYCYDDLHLFSCNTTKFNVISNVHDIVNESQVESILEKYFLKSKANKTVGFIYEDSMLYPLGLFRYNDTGYKLKYKEIESDNIVIELASNNSIIDSLNLQIKLKNYINEYNEFLTFLKSFSLEIKDNDNIQISDYLSYRKQIDSKKLSYKNYNNLIETNCMPSNKDLFYYLVYSITIELTKYINQKIQYSDKHIDLIINDRMYTKKIKLPYKFHRNTIDETCTLLPPLLPMRF